MGLAHKRQIRNDLCFNQGIAVVHGSCHSHGASSLFGPDPGHCPGQVEMTGGEPELPLAVSKRPDLVLLPSLHGRSKRSLLPQRRAMSSSDRCALDAFDVSAYFSFDQTRRSSSVPSDRGRLPASLGLELPRVPTPGVAPSSLPLLCFSRPACEHP